MNDCENNASINGAGKSPFSFGISGVVSKAAGSMAHKAVESAVSSGLAGKALSGATTIAGTTMVGKVAMGAAKGAVTGALGEVPVVSGLIGIGASDYQGQIKKAKRQAIVFSVISLIAGVLIGHFVL
mgnify:CR=1 FL=1